MSAALLWVWVADPSDMHPMDMPLPPRPAVDAFAAPIEPHALGTNTTLFVNFDGVDLSECNPSNAQRDCSWYNFEEPIEPFSGSIQTKLSVLQAMRSDVSDYGVRVTATRPREGDYTMVVYGGSEEDYEALGSAPAGDCDDALPNQIAFAHLDGELSTWVNGGATTALHEAAHSWGLDHIDFEGAIMFPTGDNGPTYFRDACDAAVDDTDLTPGGVSCPQLNESQCGDAGLQHADARLRRLFGPAYVDDTPPLITLEQPEDGQYFQAPASFEVVFDTQDDLDPQAYEIWAWLGDEGRPAEGSVRASPDFNVADLPIGTWDFHVVVADEAGNETQVDFTIEVGAEPPPDPVAPQDACACRSGDGPIPAAWFCVPLLLARRRRQR